MTDKVLDVLIEKTKDGVLDWDKPNNATYFIDHIEGKKVTIYDGVMSIEGWSYRSRKVEKLYTTIREQKRPEFVDEFFSDLLND